MLWPTLSTSATSGSTTGSPATSPCPSAAGRSLATASALEVPGTSTSTPTPKPPHSKCTRTATTSPPRTSPPPRPPETTTRPLLSHNTRDSSSFSSTHRRSSIPATFDTHITKPTTLREAQRASCFDATFYPVTTTFYTDEWARCFDTTQSDSNMSPAQYRIQKQLSDVVVRRGSKSEQNKQAQQHGMRLVKRSGKVSWSLQ
mmetsp:Transcript_2176/g.5541  ORF Transcript_2176/g.5541 Transcript_2176/m.5541 type:complete len:202 (-) Transcript_2176:878-1483(-)